MQILRTAFGRLSARVVRGSGAADRIARVERQCQEILEQVKGLNEHLSLMERRESQLRAALTRDAELDGDMATLMDVLADTRTPPHIAQAIRGAAVHRDPFPYAVIDDVLPKDLYGCLLKGLPPIELFADRPVNKQQLAVPFRLAPAYSQRVWRFVTGVAVPEFIVPAIVEKFRVPMDEWICHNWPTVPPPSVQLHSSDGRILLRRRGYRIPPHRDPKWAFLTCILYLARREDSETWGTQLYTVDADEEARGAAPHWIDPARCRSVAEVAFRRNRMLVFLNSVGAHGAHIPEDAQPETLERYIYQFRIAPTVESMSLLKATLPEDRRPFWAGKSADY
ncbi:MAG: hypothetical protein EXQ48_08390 [Acidobacteria bacterium]|nr:hypothetical protein [Acidobacteriota bacterium]